MGLRPYKEARGPFLPHEDTVGRQLSGNQEAGSHQAPMLLAP